MGGAFADDALEAFHGAVPFAVKFDFLFDLAFLQDLVDQEFELVQVHGFGEVVVRAEFHSLDGHFDGAVGGKQDHAGRRAEFPGFLQKLHPIEAGHADVSDQDVVILALEFGQGFAAIRRGIHLAVIGSEGFAQPFARVEFVIGD